MLKNHCLGKMVEKECLATHTGKCVWGKLLEQEFFEKNSWKEMFGNIMLKMKCLRKNGWTMNDWENMLKKEMFEKQLLKNVLEN